MIPTDAQLKRYGNTREVANRLHVTPSLLRYWETAFGLEVGGMGKGSGRRRAYTEERINDFKQIRDLVYRQGYTLKGAKRVFAEGRQDYRHVGCPMKIFPPQ